MSLPPCPPFHILYTHLYSQIHSLYSILHPFPINLSLLHLGGSPLKTTTMFVLSKTIMTWYSSSALKLPFSLDAPTYLCKAMYVYVLCIPLTVQEGRTPLMAAVQENRTATIRVLINDGKCDRNATNNVCTLVACVRHDDTCFTHQLLLALFCLFLLLLAARILCCCLCT